MCGRAGEGQSENLRFDGWILEVGLQVGLQKWGYIFRKVGLQNRVLKWWDREGEKYCFFNDSPEKRADRYPRNTILFWCRTGEKSVKSILCGHAPVLFEGGHRKWRDLEGITGVHVDVISGDVCVPK